MTQPALSKRLENVAESATLKLNATVQAMQSKGIDVLNFTVGEPDAWVPDVVKDAAIEAIKANRSKYTPVPGIPELRALVADKTNKQQPTLAAQRPWQANEVVVSNGAKQALFDTLLAVVDPGSEVIVPAPYWVSYPEMVIIAGGKPVVVAAPIENDFKITPKQLEAALTEKTRAIFLNSPSNPTGAVYTREEYRALGQVLLSHPHGKKVWILSDEIYDRMVYEGHHFVSFLEAVPELRDQTITINGLSKCVAMTGWRVGWTVAPKRITDVINTLQGQSTSGINAPAQWASLAALRLPESEFSKRLEVFSRRRKLALEIFKKNGKIKVFAPQGAFYFFLDVKECLKPGEDSVGFCQRLLEEAKVAMVPGSSFGAPSCIRLSFAVDDHVLTKGCERLLAFLG